MDTEDTSSIDSSLKRQRANKPLPGEIKRSTVVSTSLKPITSSKTTSSTSPNPKGNGLGLKPKPKFAMNNTVISTESQNYLKKSQIQINQTLSAQKVVSNTRKASTSSENQVAMRKCSVNSEALDLAVDQQLGEVNPNMIGHRSVNDISVGSEEGEIDDVLDDERMRRPSATISENQNVLDLHGDD